MALDSFYEESKGFLNDIQVGYDVKADEKFKANVRKDYLVEIRKGKVLDDSKR